MTKAELIDAVAQKAGVSKADAERTIGSFFELVVASAKKDPIVRSASAFDTPAF